MWIFCFHKLQTKDYNYVSRAFKKVGFIPRKISPICFTKALFLHVLQNKSWRTIGNLLGVHHITLYNFYTDYKDTPEIKKLFLHFAEIGTIVYIKEKKEFHIGTLFSDKKNIDMTKREIENIFNK